MEAQYLVIVTTFPSREPAEVAAAQLVRRKLVACAQVGGPITSTYTWEGEIETAEEWTCTLKTRADKYDEAVRSILELHPYETPEIVATPVAAGSEKYLRWIDESLS